ncbi:type IV toxin-antitoxin system AbiEi family antitoxin domain-containing protein [Spongisporangium articulatum]|uniref:Type IV toxin-antitoxin system AbiEi family antitoxin domain-containing protein n=1 Tax=Spongisporangium articulatum TaxID=3362603 RepID=A0ABW8AP98_9ACTN
MRRTDTAALEAVAACHHGLITRPDAAAHGITPATLRWALASGRLHRVMTGVFTMADHWERLTPRDRHLLVLLAAQRRSPRSVVCGLSAAVAWQLPLPEVGAPTLMSAQRRGQQAGIRWRRLAVNRARRVGALVVTSPARTVLDCARELDRPWGLAVADAALHAGLCTREELTAELVGAEPAAGLSKARWVIKRARSEPESPLESLGRADLDLAGLAVPEPQSWVPTERGWFRVDLLDGESRVVTEADGKVKYEGRPAVWAEKLRQDDIRDLQLEVVRFTMYDHHHQAPWLAQYRRALVRGRRTAELLGPMPTDLRPDWLP